MFGFGKSKKVKATEWREKGELALIMGNTQEAEKCFRTALDYDPDDAEAWNNLGTLLGINNNHSEAKACYEKAVSIRPDYCKAWQGLAVSEKNLENYDRAIEICDMLKKKYGYDASIIKEDVLRRRNNGKKTPTVNSKATKAGFSKINEKQRLTPQEEFDADLRNAMANPETGCSQDIAEILWKKYKALISNTESGDDFKRAFALLGLLLTNFEGPIEALLVMASICEQILKKPEQAAQFFKIAADKGSAYGARCYADLLMAGNVQGNISAAFPYYMQASKGGIGEASFVLGEYYRNNGMKDKALAAYRLSVEQGYDVAQTRIDQMVKKR